MKAQDRVDLTNSLLTSGKFKVFNGTLFINTKSRGWIPTTADGFNLVKDVLEKFSTEIMDNDIKSIINTIQMRAEIQYNNDKTIITTPTQRIDVKTGNITPRKLGELALDVAHDYNANAKAVDWWDKAIEMAIPAEDARKAYYEMLGLSMITDKRFEVSYWFTGTGGTGKSTIVGTVVDALHKKHNVSKLEPAEWKTTSPFFYTMANKLVNISTDDSANKTIETGTFKKLASGEELLANIKYYAPIKFQNTALLISVGNNMPVITEKTTGPFRRMIPIKMDVIVKAENKNINIKEEIEQNKDGVLDYIMKKAVEAVIEVYKTAKPTFPAESIDAIEEMKEFNSGLRTFFKTDRIKTLLNSYALGAEGYGLSRTDIAQNYNAWAKEQGFMTSNTNNISKEINDMVKHDELKAYGLKEYVRDNKKYLQKDGE